MERPDWGARIRTPASRTKTWRATPATPLPIDVQSVSRAALLVLVVVGVRVVLRCLEAVALPVDDVRPIVLRDLLGVHRRRRPLEVLGSIDELGLGELEALGLAAARLLDRAPGGIVALARRDVVVVAARVPPRLGADARGLARRLRLFAAFEFALAFHAWFLPHRDARRNRR